MTKQEQQMTQNVSPRRSDAISDALDAMDPGDTLTSCVGPEGGCNRVFDEDDDLSVMQECPLCERMMVGTSGGRA